MFGQTPRSEWTSSNKFASFNVAVENNGAEPVVPIVHITVTSPSGEEIWTIDYEAEEIGPYQRDTIDVIDFIGEEFYNVFSFNEDQMQNIELGRYLVSYSVSTDAGDDPTPNNNEKSHPFYITESAYSPATPNITTTSCPNTWGNFEEGDEIVAIFEYNTLPQGDVPVYVFIDESTTPGTAIAANIYEYNAGSYDFELSLTSGTHTITAAEIGKWIEVPFGDTHFTIEEYDPESNTKTVEVGIAFYEDGETLNLGASNDMPNKGWICRYIMSGVGPSAYNASRESVAPAICLGVPNTETTYTINVLSANGTMGYVSDGGTFLAGSSITISAIPFSGYRFVKWNDDNTTNPRTITATGNATYIAVFEALPEQYMITVLSANETMGTVNGGGTFDAGDRRVIYATPYSGYRFVSWNDGNTSNPRRISVTGNATYIASFEALPEQYTITVLSANETMGYVSGGGTFYDGDQRTITATPYSGYRFVRWNDGNIDNPRTITVTGNATYIANFEAIPVQYTITVLSASETMGSVTGGGNYYGGSQTTISAIPNVGYRFVSWNDNNTDNPRTITVTGNATYIATFENANNVVTYTITATAGPGGTINPNGVVTVYEGDDKDFTITADSGYYIISVRVDGMESYSLLHNTTDILTYRIDGVYTFATVLGHHTISAEFAEIPTFTITVNTDQPTWGTVAGSGTYYMGASVQISATPNEGCWFVGWNDNNTDNPRTITVNGNATYTARFQCNAYYSSFTATACGSYTWDNQTYTASGEYQQTLTATNYADSIVTLSLTIHPLPQPEITASGVLDGCNPSPITLSAGNYTAYNWSTGANTATINISDPGYYYVEVTDGNGCIGISNQINVGISNAIPDAPQIAVVGLNNLNQNVVSWSAVGNTNVSAYRIYRENNVANVYEPMATIEASAQTYWTDETADPSARAYRYKVTAVDECGGESPMSDYHKTMHLTINQGIGNTWNLIWSHYEGFDFGTYRIYRGTMPSNMTMIGEVPSNLNSYTDNTATANTGFYYQVEVVRNSRSRDAEISSRSNIVDNGYLPEFTITVMSSNPNRGTVSGGGTYPEGTVVRIEATALEGFVFSSWSDDNTDNPRYITVTGDAIYIASFDEVTIVPEYTITVMSSNPNRGTVTGGGTYPEGTVITIEATALEGFVFSSWSDDNTENPRQITVTADATYIASFDVVSTVPEYTITVMSANPNRGTVTGGGTYPEGTVVTIEATALEGFEFVSWSDENTENPRQITVTGDATYIASFEPATGIEESSALEIVLFPNPATDILNITSSETISEIEIVNVMGQVVKRIEVNSDNAVCDVEELKAGVYVVRIHTLNGAEGSAISQRKFVKE